MPLISDLKNKAMRPRHWEQIQAETGRSFDSASDEFTLERIIEWGFDQYNEKINEIAGAAVKELAIEQGLNDISNTWEGIELDLVPYKDKGHYKLRYVGASSSTSCHTRARATTSSGTWGHRARPRALQGQGPLQAQVSIDISTLMCKSNQQCNSI